MSIPFDSSQYNLLVASRLAEMRAIVEEARLARQIQETERVHQARQPRRLRRQVGGLLIAAGQALAR